MISNERIERAVEEFSLMLNHALKNTSVLEYSYDSRVDLVISFYTHVIFDIIFDTFTQLNANLHDDTILQILHFYLDQR